jgi:hypothetical protein
LAASTYDEITNETQLHTSNSVHATIFLKKMLFGTEIKSFHKSLLEGIPEAWIAAGNQYRERNPDWEKLPQNENES